MKQRHLFSLPVNGKSKDEKVRLAGEVDELIKGIVLLKIPDELAWTLFIESKDAAQIGTSCIHIDISMSPTDLGGQRIMTSMSYDNSYGYFRIRP